MTDFDFEHKGYLGKVVIDPDSDSPLERLRHRISGYVTNMDRAGMSFSGNSVTQAKADFVATIDDYLAYCAEEGIEVELPKVASLA